MEFEHELDNDGAIEDVGCSTIMIGYEGEYNEVVVCENKSTNH